jgi:hypothetical protein
MKTILKLEELAMFVGCILLLNIQDVEWWWYLLLFLGPDLSMIGYLLGNKIGAWSYNLFHHKGIALLIFGLGLIIQLPGDIDNKDWLIKLGIILFGHSSIDRVAGYGLKYENGFKFTHLGEIGKKV